MSCSMTLESTLSCLATSAQILLARQERGGFEASPGATGMELVDGVAAGASWHRSVPVPLVSACRSCNGLGNCSLPHASSRDFRVMEPQASPEQLGVGLCGLCFATIPCALKIARFPAVTAVPSRLPFILER